MRISITHTTRYGYSLPARSNRNELRLAPEETARQKPGSHEITIDPATDLKMSRDFFGNLVHHFEVEESHSSLLISSETEVVTNDSLDSALRSMSVPLRQLTPQTEDAIIHQFLSDSSLVLKDPQSWREAVDIHLSCEKTWGAVIQGLSDYIFDSCTYRKQLLHSMATSLDVGKEKAGTCQDFAHLMLSYCRALGLPSRYISGYLYDPGLDQNRESDFIGTGATHAWVEVHVPRVGWVGIDPTNRRWVDQNYVSVASGRDYHDVAPVKGSLLGGGPETDLEVTVTVRSLDHAARV